MALAGEKRDLLTKGALEADVRLVRIEDGRLELAMERSASRTLVNDLSRKLEQWTGRRWTVIVSNEAGQATLRSQNEVQKNQRERAAEADPRVQEVLARFPGAKVVEVRKLAPEPPESDVSGEDPAETSRQRRSLERLKEAFMADFLGMMKQAAQLQSKMQAMQEELGNVEVEGISGGGLVSVRMTAKMQVKAVKIDPSLMKADEREILEDLLVTAHQRRAAQGGSRDAGEDAGADRRARPAARTGARLAQMASAVAGPEIERLIQLLARLPGLGPRSARRAALHLIKKREALMTPLAGALQVAIDKIQVCKTCGNIDTQNPCTVCTDPRRDPSIIVVVADVADLWALERANATNGLLSRARRDAVAARRRRPAGPDHRRAGGARA